MAQPFHEQLEQLVQRHLPAEANLECQHFFSGAAMYAGGVICVSLTPVGLAFKLPEAMCAKLIAAGGAAPLKYFPKAPIKKGYALFANWEELTKTKTTKCFQQAVAFATLKSD